MSRHNAIRLPRQNSGSAPALLFYATRSGGTTLDIAEEQGNPFASALIEAAAEPRLQLRDLAKRLRKLTVAKSDGHQHVECHGNVALPAWSFVENLGAKRENRAALLLVVSDYSGLDAAASLTGAARDERRIAAMLAQYGFSVTQGIAPRRKDLLKALKWFHRQAQCSEIAVIYSTGHGVEQDGIVYLLPADYPVRAGVRRTALMRHAVSVPQLVEAASAPRQNLVFFAGCRTCLSND